MTNRFVDEPIVPLGVLVGGYLVLAGLGTIFGQPWATKGSTVALVIQLIGVVLLVGLGAYLVWAVRQG